MKDIIKSLQEIEGNPSLVHNVDDQGKTILHQFTIALNTETKQTNYKISDYAQYVLRFSHHGINPYIKDNQGKTAFDYLENNLQNELFAVFLFYGFCNDTNRMEEYLKSIKDPFTLPNMLANACALFSKIMQSGNTEGISQLKDYILNLIDKVPNLEDIHMNDKTLPAIFLDGIGQPGFIYTQDTIDIADAIFDKVDTGLTNNFYKRLFDDLPKGHEHNQHRETADKVFEAAERGFDTNREEKKVELITPVNNKENVIASLNFNKEIETLPPEVKQYFIELQQSIQNAAAQQPDKIHSLKHCVEETKKVIEAYNLYDKATTVEEKENAGKQLLLAVGEYENKMAPLYKESVGKKVFLIACTAVGALLGFAIGAVVGLAVGAAIGGGIGSVIPVFGTIGGAFLAGGPIAAITALKGAGIGVTIATAAASYLMTKFGAFISSKSANNHLQPTLFNKNIPNIVRKLKQKVNDKGLMMNAIPEDPQDMIIYNAIQNLKKILNIDDVSFEKTDDQQFKIKVKFKFDMNTYQSLCDKLSENKIVYNKNASVLDIGGIAHFTFTLPFTELEKMSNLSLTNHKLM